MKKIPTNEKENLRKFSVLNYSFWKTKQGSYLFSPYSFSTPPPQIKRNIYQVLTLEKQKKKE